jgi:uncharacterized protein YyaL (SSP411 family)
VVGPTADPRTAELHRAALLGAAPGAVVAVGEEGSAEFPLLRDRPTRAGRPAAYVCRHFVCDAPTSDPRTLSSQLRQAREA